MVPKLAFLSSLLLASAALAVPSSQLEAREVATRHKNDRRALAIQPAAGAPSSDIELAQSTGNNNLAGAFWDLTPGALSFVTATFVVPVAAVSEHNGSLDIFGSLDYDSANSLRVGVGVKIVNSQPLWTAFYQLPSSPRLQLDRDDFPVKPLDEIMFNITATDNMTFMVFIENHGIQKIWKQGLFVSSDAAFSLKSAGWFLANADPQYPLPSFSRLNLYASVASGRMTFTPWGAQTLDISSGNTTFTSTKTSSSGLQMDYIIF